MLFLSSQAASRLRASCRLATAAVFFTVSACADAPLDDLAQGAVERDETASSDEAAPPFDEAPIIGGAPSTECGWPSTVRVTGASSCTGTLIHSRIVTTAAHCVSGTQSQATVSFGTRGSPGTFSLPARCRAGARGQTGVNSGRDWAYCVLPEDARVARIPVTPPLVGCEASRFLKTGASVWMVGYGNTSYSGGAGRKREVELSLNAINPLGAGTLLVGDRVEGGCYGDSGGPVYMRLVDASGRDFGFRVIGATSGPGQPTNRACRCNCGTTLVNIAQHVAAIEANEGIDVTPCTDARGAWAPGPRCRALPANPQRASGTYPACSMETTTAPIESCGPAAR